MIYKTGREKGLMIRMKNYKMILAFDGTRYFGWERRDNTDMTIQGKLEHVLSVLEGEAVEVIGCSRTDAGVHAKAMVVNVKLKTETGLEELRSYMNRYLPEDIVVTEVKIASERFHSRYHATGKTYCYTCYVGDTKPVFDRKYVYALEKQPDLAQMKLAAEYLIGTHDFASFSANKKKKKSTVRTIDKIDIAQCGDYVTITVHGDGFLHHMVRILAGTLLEVGWGKRSACSMEVLLEAKTRAQAGFMAPAQGLCLMSVDY